MKETWGEVKERAKRRKKRWVATKLSQPSGQQAWSVEDVNNDKTKAVFYDECSEVFAKDFCRQLNEATEAERK